MKKVNIQNELNHLQEKEISSTWLGINHGNAIKKTDMSEYLTDCYNRSTKVECCNEVTLKYKYYMDEINWVCILFTSSVNNNHNNDNETEHQVDTIIVNIYMSEIEFNSGVLIQHIFFSLYEKDANNWDFKDKCYVTDCIKYNEFPIIQDIRKLKRHYGE